MISFGELPNNTYRLTSCASYIAEEDEYQWSMIRYQRLMSKDWIIITYIQYFDINLKRAVFLVALPSAVVDVSLWPEDVLVMGYQTTASIMTIM